MKNKKKSEVFLVEASECFLSKMYMEALGKYNQCLRFAPNSSQLMSDAYAGRAKTFFALKHFKLCNENVQIAISASGCEKKCKSYKELQQDCDETLKNISSENEEYNFQLSRTAHKNIPFIIESLEVRENDLYGRYISTSKDLDAGEVVVFEEPFYKVLHPELRHKRCAVCLQQNKMNLSPCAKCDGEC